MSEKPLTTDAEIRPATGHDDLVAVWEDLTDERYRRDMSHWRCEGRWDDAAWQAIGQGTLALLRRTAAALGRDLPTGPMLEWGPGGGTNLLAFSAVSRRLFGADVSRSNLAEAARVLEGSAGSAPLTPILVGDDPAAVAASIDEPIEVFVSTAVFQHFPDREYGARVLRTVASVLAPDAIGLVQIRFDDGSPRYAQKDVDYRKNHVTFTSYPLSAFWDVLIDAGLRPLAITGVRTDCNYATFTFVPA